MKKLLLLSLAIPSLIGAIGHHGGSCVSRGATHCSMPCERPCKSPCRVNGHTLAKTTHGVYTHPYPVKFTNVRVKCVKLK